MMTDVHVSVGDAQQCCKPTEMQVCVSRLMMPAVYILLRSMWSSSTSPQLKLSAESMTLCSFLLRRTHAEVPNASDLHDAMLIHRKLNYFTQCPYLHIVALWLDVIDMLKLCGNQNATRLCCFCCDSHSDSFRTSNRPTSTQKQGGGHMSQAQPSRSRWPAWSVGAFHAC